jgi:hypothetical protein
MAIALSDIVVDQYNVGERYLVEADFIIGVKRGEAKPKFEAWGNIAGNTHFIDNGSQEGILTSGKGTTSSEIAETYFRYLKRWS